MSSPLGRARETMELMRSAMGLDPSAYRTDARLMEMSFGRWEGFTYAELQAREAEALAARERDKWGFVLPGGESYAQLEKRVQVWYEAIGRASVVSAHGGVCRALMALLKVVQPSEASMGDIGQGCHLRVQRQRDDAPRVICLLAPARSRASSTRPPARACRVWAATRRAAPAPRGVRATRRRGTQKSKRPDFRPAALAKYREGLPQ